MYESYYFGVMGPGFLNQVPTLGMGAVSCLGIRNAVQAELEDMDWLRRRERAALSAGVPFDTHVAKAPTLPVSFQSTPALPSRSFARNTKASSRRAALREDDPCGTKLQPATLALEVYSPRRQLHT